MNKLFSSYKIQLDIISPVHIGSGEEYVPTDYVIKNKQLFVINRAKFISKIEKIGKYEEFLSICDSGNILKIRKFIYDNFDESLVEFKIDVTTDIQNEYAQKLDKPSQIESANRRVINALEIRKLAYSNFENKIIIPGSSIKGAIRTAILDYFAKNKEFKNDFKRNFRKLQECLLDMNLKDTSTDPFSKIKVSDFQLVQGSSVIDIISNIKNFDNANRKGVPVKMEIIKPEAIFQGEILIHKDSEYKIEDILTWCNQHYLEDTYNFEKNYFKYENSAMPQIDLKKNNFYLKIGQHSGAFAVTLSTYRNGNIWHQKLKKNLDHQTTTWMSESFNMPLGWVRCKVLNENTENKNDNTTDIVKKGSNTTKPTSSDLEKLIEKFGKNHR